MPSAGDTGPNAPAPLAAAQRLDVLDALRGIALFGVLLANKRDFSQYGLLPAATAACGQPGKTCSKSDSPR